MPTYDFYNSTTNEIEEHFLKISELDDFKTNNPHLERLVSAPSIVGTVGSIDSKTPDSWKEVLAKGAERHPDSPLAERYGRKSIKQIKTEQVVAKHRKKWSTE